MPTLTIDLTTAQALRLSKAIGKVADLGHDASIAEAETFLRDTLKRMVLRYERREAEAAISESGWGG